MSYENLQNLTVSNRGNIIEGQIPLWRESIENDGYAVVSVYHNKKMGTSDIKSMVVRKALGKYYPTLYFVHATEDSGAIRLIISNRKKVFSAMKWEYRTHVTEAVE